ncbi:MAG: hypothetical protein A2052_06370 [Deltaproteobacteria bacterium GWA2_54_12]|nr:MAG: hypothetical protein A2052_06370 [Deltaproteobacteria bacterium GWA2_54_12]
MSLKGPRPEGPGLFFGQKSLAAERSNFRLCAKMPFCAQSWAGTISPQSQDIQKSFLKVIE